MLWFVIVLKYSLSNHNITSPLSYNIAILPLSHHITGIIAGQVHRVHLNMCKCLGNSSPKNMFSIFLNLHSQSVMFLAKCNLVVLCQKKARFFFSFYPQDNVHRGQGYAVSELSQKLQFPLMTPVPSPKHLTVCFSQLDCAQYLWFYSTASAVLISGSLNCSASRLLCS